MEKLMRFASITLCVVAFIALGNLLTYAQRGSATLFGDVKIDESGVSNSAPPKVMLVLYKICRW